MTQQLEGKRALITGSAFGIGRAIAMRVAREGARVTLGDIAPDGEAVAEEIRGMGGDAQFLKTDVTCRADIDALVAQATEDGAHPLHIAFANAGIEGRLGAPTDVEEDAFRHLLDVNVIGAWRVMASVLPGMIARGSGSIVATASVGGLVGAGGLAPYVASKHAVVGLVRSVALDVAEAGVRVNALCPGMVETGMLNRLAQSTDGFREALLDRKPMGRIGEPEEIAEAALWLASDQASYVTGHALAVDGGFAAQ